MISSLILTSVLLTISTEAQTGCVSSSPPIDVIFILDSSGSVHDDNFTNWNGELTFVEDIISGEILPDYSRISLINYGSRIKKEFGLNDYEYPFEVYNAVDAINEDDFLGGWTWTNEALNMSLNEFKNNSSTERSKFIILVTDGYPTPGHQPCRTSENCLSKTFMELKEFNVNIIIIGIGSMNGNAELNEEYINCMVDNVESDYFQRSFNDLYDAEKNREIGEGICSKLELEIGSSSTMTNMSICGITTTDEHDYDTTDEQDYDTTMMDGNNLSDVAEYSLLSILCILLYQFIF